MTKCHSCKAAFQSEDENKKGYLPPNIKIKNDTICKRCYRLKHYDSFEKKNINHLDVIKKVNDLNKTIIYITDIINFNPQELPTCKTILVINKIDLIEKQINTNKLINRIINMVPSNVESVFLISSLKPKNISQVINKIKSLNQPKVYILGPASSGKTTFINKLLDKYEINQQLLTSYHPGVTIDFTEIKINNNLTIIDTPGLEIDAISIFPKEIIKKVYGAKKIKPITFQLNQDQSLIIENLVRINYLKGEKNSFTLFLPTNIKYSRKKILKEHQLDSEKETIYNLAEEDLVISGLGFLKVKEPAQVSIKKIKEIKIFKRDSLI